MRFRFDRAVGTGRPVKYRILMHVEVDARDDSQALEWANKLGELLKNPLVRMSIEGEGIRVTGETQVYTPQRNGA